MHRKILVFITINSNYKALLLKFLFLLCVCLSEEKHSSKVGAGC